MSKRIKMFLIIKDNSERIPRKNFQLIANIPLHEYFMRSRSNFDVYIDTDSDEILKYYNNNPHFPNVVAYRRLQEHIDIENDGNSSPAPQMIKRFIDEVVSDHEEIIVTSHITSPFIKDDTIMEAITMMDQFNSVSSVQSVQEFAVFGLKDNAKPINFNPEKVVKTQSLQPVGILNGAFFIIRAKIFLENGSKRISDRHYYHPISDIEAIDIDTPVHLQIARSIAKQMDR